MRKTAWLGTCVALLLVPGSILMFGGQEGRVEGRGVYFSPHPAAQGETMRITVGFQVTGGPISLTASVEQTTPRSSGPPPATLVLGSFNAGERTADVYRYTVPASPPERLCFTIKMTGGEFRDVCLKRVRGSRGWTMDIEIAGRWFSVPSPVPSSSTEKADLRIVGDLALDDTVRVENIGRAAAPYIRVQKECWVEERWAPSTEFESPKPLLPGQSLPFRVGRLAGARGPCPAGSTKVRLVVDSRNLIAEMNENNNALEASTLADLRIVDFRIIQEGLGATATSALVGFGLNFELSNTGTGDAGAFAWEVSVFRDGEWRSFIGERVPGLAAGRHFSKAKIDVSRHVREGERVRLRVDPLNQVPETNEADNARESVVRN